MGNLNVVVFVNRRKKQIESRKTILGNDVPLFESEKNPIFVRSKTFENKSKKKIIQLILKTLTFLEKQIKSNFDIIMCW